MEVESVSSDAPVNTRIPTNIMPKSVDDPKAQAAWIAAVGEPTRLVIIRVLATGVKTVTELAQACNTEIVNASHHLGVMRAAGLVEAERDGRFMRYRLLGASANGSALELVHSSGVKVVIPLG
jgi:DNA-binding transcriptional ArsR family regulator